MQFGSDNQTGCAHQVLDAISAANRGHTHGYGNDEWTARAAQALEDVFETKLDVFFVATGTAANCLALSGMVRPWQIVLCHAQSHLAIDESTAPEFFTGGARVQGIGAGEGKLTEQALSRYLERMGKDLPHNPQPAAVSITQATECGLVYSPEEITRLAAIAHGHGMTVHMDGARFSNALVAQGCSPADLTWRAGVDVLTLGATKNGCLAAEAIVVFRKDLAVAIENQRKRSGHLLSKGRFFGAQVHAWLHEGLWLSLAKHANEKAAQLAAYLMPIPGVTLAWPVQANEVFVVMRRAVCELLQKEGAEFYEWYPGSLPTHLELKSDEVFVRFVCSFATTDADIDTLNDRILDLSGSAPFVLSAGVDARMPQVER